MEGRVKRRRSAGTGFGESTSVSASRVPGGPRFQRGVLLARRFKHGTHLVCRTGRVWWVGQQRHGPTQLLHRGYGARRCLALLSGLECSRGREVLARVGDCLQRVSCATQLDVGLQVNGELERGLKTGERHGKSPRRCGVESERQGRTLVFFSAVLFSPTQLRISSRLCSSRPRSTLAISSHNSSSTRSSIPSSAARALADSFRGGLMRWK